MSYYSDEDDWVETYPVPATVIGCAAILGLGYFGLPYAPPAPLPVVMGAAFGVALLVWGFAWLVTIRHASGNAKLLSFLLIVAAAMGVAYYSTAYLAEQRIKADLRTLAEMEIGPNGFPTFPPGAEKRGPISKLYIAMIREMTEGQKSIDDAAAKSGLNLLADATALKADPALLSDCGRIAKVKTLAHDVIERRRVLLRDLIKAIDATDYPDEFKQGMHDSMAVQRTDDNLVRMNELQDQTLDAAQGACTVLARRHWVPQGAVFMFNSQGDLNSFAAFGQRQNQAAAEFQRLQYESLARARANQAYMRQALGKSSR